MLTPLSSLSILYPKHLQRLASIAEKAMAKQQCDSILIHSGAPKLAFLDDYHHPYKANPHFTWWLPITQSPHCYLLIQTDQKPVLFYHLADDFWHVPPQPPKGFWCDYFDIYWCRDLAQVKREIKRYSHTSEHRAWIGEDIGLACQLGIHKVNPEGLMHQLHFARAIKSQYEIACLTQANDMAFAGHQAANQAFMAGKSELDTAFAYLSAVQQDSMQMPYRNIVAFGHHSAILHYQHYDHRPQDMSQPQSFLIDAGATFNGYGADVTRCHSRGSGLYQDLINAMTQAQAKLCAQANPGISFVDLHQQMHHLVLEILITFNLVQGSKDELLTSHISSAFFPHGLGHLLGLQVHDVGGWQQDELGTMLAPPTPHEFLRCTKTLQENMVITIEPGLYIIDSLLEKWKSLGFAHLLNTHTIGHLRPLGGVRIEDNIVVAQAPVKISK